MQSRPSGKQRYQPDGQGMSTSLRQLKCQRHSRDHSGSLPLRRASHARFDGTGDGCTNQQPSLLVLARLPQRTRLTRRTAVSLRHGLRTLNEVDSAPADSRLFACDLSRRFRTTGGNPRRRIAGDERRSRFSSVDSMGRELRALSLDWSRKQAACLGSRCWSTLVSIDP